MGTTIYDPAGAPIELGAGRGDLRFSSFPGGVRQSTSTMVAGGKIVSYADLFASQPWVGAAVMRLITWGARVPLKCYRRGPDGEHNLLTAADHPLAAVIERPWLGRELGPATQVALVGHLLGPLLVHGNALINIVNDSSGFYLEPLDWRFILPLGLQDGVRLYGWRVQQGIVGRDISINDTVHIAWWSSVGPLGISPLEQLGITTRIEDAAQRYQYNLFNNGARPPSAVTTSDEFLNLKREEREMVMAQVREDMDALYTGVDNAGRPPILPPGLDWKPVGQSAVEAELIRQREITRQEIAAVYQIPAQVLGGQSEHVGQAMKVYRDMAYTDSLGPRMVLLEQTLTAVLARDTLGEGDVFYEFDFEPILRGDRLAEINALRAAIGSAMVTPNEARRSLNMDPFDNPAADELYLPVNNLQPLGSPPASGPPDPSNTDPASSEPAPGMSEDDTAALSDELNTIVG